MLLSLVYCIPFDWMEANLDESVVQLDPANQFPEHYASLGDTRYDDYTTAVMLNIAAHSGGCPFVESLLNPLAVLGEAPIEAVALYVGDPSETRLDHNVYPRYWHGYLIVLKPLLIWFDLKEIRIIFQTLFLLALVAVAMSLVRRFGVLGMLSAGALTVSLGLFGAMDAAANLPLFFSFVISLVGMLWAARLRQITVPNVMLGFVLLGAAAAFFDFLDNPLLVFALPAAILALNISMCSETANTGLGVPISKVQPNEPELGRCHVVRMLALALLAAAAAWVVGYGGFWCAKWILVTVVTGNDVIAMGLAQMEYRSGYGVTNPVDAIRANFAVVGKAGYLIVVIAAGCMAVGLIDGIIATREKMYTGRVSPFLRSSIALGVALAVVATSPYVWYVVLSQHSFMHAEFISYRTQLIALFCLLFALLQGIAASVSRLRAALCESGNAGRT